MLFILVWWIMTVAFFKIFSVRWAETAAVWEVRSASCVSLIRWRTSVKIINCFAFKSYISPAVLLIIAVVSRFALIINNNIILSFFWIKIKVNILRRIILIIFILWNSSVYIFSISLFRVKIFVFKTWHNTTSNTTKEYTTYFKLFQPSFCKIYWHK